MPSQYDVGHKLKLTVTAQLGDVLKVKTVETDYVFACPPPSPERPLVATPLLPHLKPIQAAQGFRCVTYNMLAEIYATQQQYPYTPMWALSWSFRRHLLVREVARYDADVLCLQEVQTDSYNGFLYQAMVDLGYEGLHKQKTRAAMGVEGKVDGCALFFKRDRFRLLEKYVIEFNDAAEATYKLKGSQSQMVSGIERGAIVKRRAGWG